MHKLILFTIFLTINFEIFSVKTHAGLPPRTTPVMLPPTLVDPEPDDIADEG